MNKKISPTLMGAFVVGALALLVIAIMAFWIGKVVPKNIRIRAFLPGLGKRA